MEHTFTEFVRNAKPGVQPNAVVFDAMWKKLRAALINEIKKRGLWNVPPRYLGIEGSAGWLEGEALEELLTECYIFIFLERLPGLKAQLKVKENIEGLVFLSLHNFLYDTQKKHDPLGFKTFTVLQAAVRLLLAEGTLAVLGGDPKVKNGTVLGFPRHEVSGPDCASCERVDDLDSQVRSWSDDLLPDLVTARGQAIDLVVIRLANYIRQLPAAGITDCRFEDMIAPLKSGLRARWRAVWSELAGETALQGGEEGDEEGVRVIQVVRPTCDVDSRDSFDKLVDRVNQALRENEEPPSTQSYLLRVWSYLAEQAAEPGAGKLPTRRSMARELGIPRGRMTGLCVALGRFIQEVARP